MLVAMSIKGRDGRWKEGRTVEWNQRKEDPNGRGMDRGNGNGMDGWNEWMDGRNGMEWNGMDLKGTNGLTE